MKQNIAIFALFVALLGFVYQNMTRECQIPARLAQNYLDAHEEGRNYVQMCIFPPRWHPKLQSAYDGCDKDLNVFIEATERAMSEMQKAIAKCEGD